MYYITHGFNTTRHRLFIHHKDQKSQFIKLFSSIFIGSFIIGLSLICHYYLSVNNEQRYALHKEKITVELIKQTLAENLANMAADAKNFAFITQSLMALPQADNKTSLNRYFLQFIKNQSDYSQIRLLDKTGQELVRVNHQNNRYEIVKENALQDKSHRYYFQKSLQLAPGQVYISPLDQNMEEGQVEQPTTPTIRLSAPVYHQGQVLGVIVLNYPALPLIKQLLRLSPYFLNQLYIVNNEATAIIQPLNQTDVNADSKLLLNQEIKSNQEIKPNQLSFIDINGAKNAFKFDTKNTPPKPIQALIRQHKKGHLANSDAYLTLASSLAPDNSHWHVVSSFSKRYFTQIRTAFFQQYWVFYALLYLFMVLVCCYRSINQNRQQKYAQQRAYEQQFRQILEQIKLLAVSLNHKGGVVFCNDLFIQRMGYQKEQIIGQSWVDLFIPTELKEQVTIALQQTLEQGQNQTSFKDVIQDKSGQIHLVTWTSTFLKKAPRTQDKLNNEQLGVLTFVGEDITQQAQTQAQLQQLNHAVEQSQNSIMITDLNGKIIYVNPTFCEVTAYQEEEVLGKSPKFLQSGELKQDDYQAMWQALLRGHEWRGELHNKRKDGSLFWERAVISPVKDVDGKNLYYVGVKQDISHEKQLAQALENETKKTLQHEKLAAIGKVVSMIAHDLRNPLSSIKMVLQIYQRKNQDELCQISLQQVAYMEAILADLLTYSKPEKQQAQWLDFNKFVNQVLMSQERLANENKVSIELNLAPNLPTLFADPTKLKQALQNILTNAIQAASSCQQQRQKKVRIESHLLLLNGPIYELEETLIDQVRDSNLTRLGITRQGQGKQAYLMLSIFNTGIPIDNSLIKKAFEPFFTTKASGTGLGLAIVKRILDLHEGLIKIRPINQQNDINLRGTQVCIALPTQMTQVHLPNSKQEEYEQVTHM
ncbi:PAS domain S-box protein [Marinomonas sp. MED121]|uniref:PAS domain S-box protein n=1 Tax=Marinomonas sp. MED121 TaxID=314277 RepID=UPI0013EFA4D4|nr:PAS domain S-box protein [Marinomonas sp. MED121]